jgi:putative ABC transport system permease protein
VELSERLRQARESVADRPRQVAASALGVFAGAAAMVVLLAWSSGFAVFMTQTFSHFGRPLVFAVPGITSSGFPGQRAGVEVRIDRRDARAAERDNRERVDAVVAEHHSSERLLVEARGRVRRLDLTGTDERFPTYRNFRVAEGRFFDAGEVERARAVAVLGWEAAGELFGDPRAAVGRTLRVEGRPFELIGVLDEKTGRQNINTNRPDNRLLVVPVSAAEAQLGYDEESVSVLSVYPRDGVSGETALGGVLASLAGRGRFHPDDRDAIRHFDLTAILGALDLMSLGFTLFIGLAGTVTLLVGAVGIANYHLALLAEREVEIAIAKAIGARNRTLMLQGALESVLVSGVASVSGVALGLAVCQSLLRLAPSGMFPVPIVSATGLAVTAFALAAVGVVSGLIPALRVRRIDVALALRAA